MRTKKALERIQQLLKKHSFTTAEAKKYGVSAATLGYYLQIGTLKRLSRGVYQSSDHQSSAHPNSLEHFMWEDLITALSSVTGGVICLISALAIYEITEEIPREHWVAVSHNTTIKRKRGIRIMRFRDVELGKTHVELCGVSVQIFDRERTIVDAFRLLSKETAIKALKMACEKKGHEQIDLNRLQLYAKKLRVNLAPYIMMATT
jgi:predicted transcriptional regulator of viral defense system